MRRVVLVFVPFILALSIVAALLFPVMVRLLTDDRFLESWPIFTILLAGVVINAGFRPFQGVFVLTGRPGLHSLFFLIIVFSNAILNILFIPRMGTIGTCGHIVGVCHRIAPDTLRNTQNPGGQRSLCLSTIGIDKIGTALTSICILPMPVYASSSEASVRELVMEIGRLKLFIIIILIACFISARLVARGPSFGRKLLLGLVLLTFFASQGRSVLGTYRNNSLYQRRKTMALSDLQIQERLFEGRLFRKKSSPLLVADYMPQAKVFLYDENLYPKELLGWSRQQSRQYVRSRWVPIDYGCLTQGSLLGSPSYHFRGIVFRNTTLDLQKEKQVFLMKDGLMDYLVRDPWRVSQHE